MRLPGPGEVIRGDGGRMTHAQVDAFRHAVRASSAGIPPTFATCFRASEFQWLDRLKVDMHRLLHTAQEYEFREPLRPGQNVTMVSRLIDDKSRRGLRFLSVQTDILADGKIAVVADTKFVLREGEST